MAQEKTINIVIAALGGEGGGVFTNWLIDVAKLNGWQSQTTSLAGVAQRTGATIYYIELFPENSKADAPVMSLFPAQGDIDIAVSSEIAEAGRMIQRGFVTPEKTTLISSSHRVFAIDEKVHLGDGTTDEAVIVDMAEKYAKRFVCYDLATLAKQHNSVISSALFGALAGSSSLPFEKESYIEVIKQTGKLVESNIASFEASYQVASNGKGKTNDEEPQEEVELFILPEANTKKGRRIFSRIKEELPEPCHEVVYHGCVKAQEYQDIKYVEQYLDNLTRCVGKKASDKHSDEYIELVNTTARYLALWMCFEDIPRVAQLKIRANRFSEIREEVQAKEKQIIHVTEFFRPRAEEICAILPKPIGSMMESSQICQKVLNVFAGGKKLRTDSLKIHFVLRFLSLFAKFRRSSLGYHHEHSMINQWLQSIKSAYSNSSIDSALAIAELGGLVKGYGDTRARTTSQVLEILDYQASDKNINADKIRHLLKSALSSDDKNVIQQEVKINSN